MRATAPRDTPTPIPTAFLVPLDELLGAVVGALVATVAPEEVEVCVEEVGVVVEV